MAPFLSDTIFNLLSSPRCIMDTEKPDRRIWRNNNNGQFTVASASRLGSFEKPKWVAAYLWKVKLPPRIQLFAWLLSHNRLLTNVNRYHCHLTNSDICGVCVTGPEYMEHTFRTCCNASQVWLSLDMHNFHLL